MGRELKTPPSPSVLGRPPQSRSPPGPPSASPRCCLPGEGCASWRRPRQRWHLSPGLQRELLFFLLFSKATGKFAACRGLP